MHQLHNRGDPMKIFKMLVMIIISIMIFSALTIPAAEALNGEREFKLVHINLKQGYGLSPETEHNSDTEAQTQTVQADYQDGLIGRTDRQWVDVGTWTSSGIDSAFTLDSGQYKFNMWFQVADTDYQADPDWEFTLRHNEENLASVQILNTAESNTEPIEVWATTNIGSPVDAASGDTFEIFIRYRAWEDCTIYYDNVTYDAGGVGSMDSVVILSADKSSAKFHDAWGINWDAEGKYYCELNYGGTVNIGSGDTEISEGGDVEGDNGTTYSTTKIKFNNIDEGDGDVVQITINYGHNESSEGWTANAGSTGGGGGGDGDDDSSDDELSVATIGAVGGVVVVLAAVKAYLFVFKKRGEESEDDEEEYEEYEDEEYEDEDEEE